MIRRALVPSFAGAAATGADFKSGVERTSGASGRAGAVWVRSTSGGGSLGARVESVPLPKVKDYLPPKELREELERSLREKRPASYDEVIKEYFKRISQ